MRSITDRSRTTSQADREAAAARALRAPAPAAPGPLVARAAAAGALPPADVLRLQRTIGNRATGRILGSLRASTAGVAPRMPGVVQRTVADPFDGSLYVPPAWLDSKIDDRDEKVRDLAFEHGTLRNELLANVGGAIGIPIASVTEVKQSESVLDKMKENGRSLHGANAKARRVRRLRSTLRDAVREVASVMTVPGDAIDPDGSEVVNAQTLHSRPTLLPNHVVKAPDDLTGGYDIEKVCALIALVKAEPRSALNAKLRRDRDLRSDAEYYQALHNHYYTTKHVQYDEPATHPPLYTEWGYTMVFSGGSSFRGLPNVLRKPLAVGKKYIMSIRGHVVYVTMKKQMQPGVAMGEREVLADYFEYHSDPANYNVSHDRDVDYIYEK